METNYKYDLKDQHIIVIEDIVETGRSMFLLYQDLWKYSPKTIKIFCLLGNESVEYPDIKDKLEYFWEYDMTSKLAGYGFDYHEHHW